MELEDEDYKTLIDKDTVDSEEDISDFEEFEDYYGLGEDRLDDDGEIKELNF